MRKVDRLWYWYWYWLRDSKGYGKCEKVEEGEQFCCWEEEGDIDCVFRVMDTQFDRRWHWVGMVNMWHLGEEVKPRL